MQIGIGAVDRIVGAEQNLAAPPSLDRLERAFDGHPCCVAVQVIRLAEQLDRLAVIGPRSMCTITKLISGCLIAALYRWMERASSQPPVCDTTGR